MTNGLNKWERFLDSLSTEGGHLVLWIILIVCGVVMEKVGIPYGHEVIVSSVTGFGIALKTGARSNNTRINGGTTEPEKPA